MAAEQLTVQRGFRLTEQTISKPDATLEVKIIDIPQSVKDEISQNLERGRQLASETAPRASDTGPRTKYSR
jgi:hypothetical protein